MDNRQRLLSLDALRGFDMVWLIGLASAVRAFCGAFPGGDEWWLARQMHHCNWEGFRFYDLIFPLFLFMAGVSFPFSYASQVRRGVSSLKIHRALRQETSCTVDMTSQECGYGSPNHLMKYTGKRMGKTTFRCRAVKGGRMARSDYDQRSGNAPKRSGG